MHSETNEKPALFVSMQNIILRITLLTREATKVFCCCNFGNEYFGAGPHVFPRISVLQAFAAILSPHLLHKQISSQMAVGIRLEDRISYLFCLLAFWALIKCVWHPE